MKQKERILAEVVAWSKLTDQGISSAQISNIIHIPQPTVRKYMNEFAREKKVTKKIIRSNRTLYWVKP